jgi:transposase
MPYSQDLRKRVVAAAESGEHSQAKVAAMFGLSLSTVEKWLRRQRATGDCAALPHGGGRQRALQADAKRIETIVAKQPDVTLAELCERVAKAGGAQASRSAMGREVQRLRLRRKKVAP